jgi:hypothetical protein
LCISGEDIAAACTPLVEGVRGLIDEVLAETQPGDVCSVRCIGGGSKLQVLADVIQAAFPRLTIRQMNPDNTLASGAAIDSAQRAKRLPPHLQMPVTSVAPYSIGIRVFGEIICFAVQRGESMPAEFESSFVTVEDYETSMNFSVFQGEHLLPELNDQIGNVALDHLPGLLAGECYVRVKLRYDEDGILRFSAQDVMTRQLVRARFQAQTKFTESDHSRLRLGLPGDLQAEIQIAEQRRVWAFFDADVNCPENSHHRLQQKWAKWLETHTTTAIEILRANHRQALSDFRMTYSLSDGYSRLPLTDFKLIEIWPTGPQVARQGAAFIRFICVEEFVVTDGDIQDLSTEEVTGSIQVWRFARSEGIENVVRVAFPKDGRYKVELFLKGRDPRTWSLPDPNIGHPSWRFDVSGCPAHDCPESGIADCPAYLRIDPPMSTVRLLGTQHAFSCKLQGNRLSVSAIADQDEKGTVITAIMGDRHFAGDWWEQPGTISLPTVGRWRISFAVDGFESFRQVVVAREVETVSCT